MLLYVPCNTVENSQTWKSPKCPSGDEEIKEMCTYTGQSTSQVIKKMEMLPFMTTWMGCGAVMQSEGNQSEKDQYGI